MQISKSAALAASTASRVPANSWRCLGGDYVDRGHFRRRERFHTHVSNQPVHRTLGFRVSRARIFCGHQQHGVFPFNLGLLQIRFKIVNANCNRKFIENRDESCASCIIDFSM